VAAHELRTPLTTLRLQAQQFARNGSASAGSRSLLRSVDRLCRLVDQLLDVSRITAGRVELQLEWGDLRPLVQEAASRLSDEAEGNGCKVSVSAPAPVIAEFDPLRIEQVVANLVTNAIKYGRGKPIELSVSQADGKARLRVRDHGIGVPSGEEGRIFDRFTRAVSLREYGGLGLGLFISRQIVEAHGGVIRVESEPGEGASFEVEIPVERVRAGLELHA
jgi:signal transduction histidine kinase